MNNFSFLILFGAFICGQSERLFLRVDDVKCEAQLKYLSASLLKRESWALERKYKSENISPILFSSQYFPFPRRLSLVFDSWTKFQSGIFYGNQIDFGNFDQCLDFQHKSSDLTVGLVQGQHCLIYYRATMNASSPPATIQPDGIFDWSEM